jgi:hypothetical protein
MNRIIHCKRHRPLRRQNPNFQKKDKFQLVTRYPNQLRTTKINGTNYRSANRMKINGDVRKEEKHLLRLSLPVYIPERIR